MKSTTTAMNSNAKSTKTSTTSTDVDSLHPDSNVLSARASRDEVDVHWFFNWAEGELTSNPAYSIFQQQMLGARCARGIKQHVTEPTEEQLASAARARRVAHVLDRIGSEHVLVLQRWAAAPRSYPEPLRRQFKRLAGLALRTRICRFIGGPSALVSICEIARVKPSNETGTDLQVAQREIQLARTEAENVLRDAFAIFATEREMEDRSIHQRDQARRLKAYQAEMEREEG